MLFYLIALTFFAGIVIHTLVLHYPTWLHYQWGKECKAYLQERQIAITAPIEKSLQCDATFKKIAWQYYVPFIFMITPQREINLRSNNTSTWKLRIFTLDIVLFISSSILFYQFDSYLYWATGLLFTWIIITSSFIDAETQLLPDELTYILLWTGLVASCWNLYTCSMSAILGVFVAYSGLWILSFLFKCLRKKDGIGQGDLKLLAAITAWTGLYNIPLTLFLSSLICLGFIVLRRLFLHREFSAPIAFGPFLAFAGWLVLLWGREIVYYLHL